jgi:hypothetical protein
MILSRKYGIALIMAIIIFIPNVYAIKVSVSNGDRTSYSGDYRLDKSTSLRDNILLASEGIFQERQASGSGNNAIVQSIGGDDYSGKSSLITSGSFGSSSSSVVTSNAGTLSQDASADGDAFTMVSATSCGGSVLQSAGVDNGALTSSQSLAVGTNAIAVQNTDLKGGDGTFEASALSLRGQVETVSGYYEGGGNLDAQMASISDQGTTLQGAASLNGLDLIDNGILQEVESQEGGMSVDGLFESKVGGEGKFGLSALILAPNLSPSKISSGGISGGQIRGEISDIGSHPEIVGAPLGNPNAFVLNSGMIDPKNPIQLYLRSDSNLKAEGLDPSSVAQSISSAANSWDYWTKPNQNNLFRQSVIIDSTKQADKRGGYSMHAFTSMDPAYIAYARTWYDKGNKYIVETDICYNIDRTWTTDWQLSQNTNGLTKDVQTLALHELGHACGLGDLYSLPSSDPRIRDYQEIMSGYHGPQHALGAGDIKGLQKKYGA